MKSALSLLALALLGLLFLQWRDWPPELPEAPQESAAGDAQQPQGGAPSADDLLAPPPPKEDYASVAERPLFLPDRRPPPDDPEPDDETLPETLTELDGMDLTAVVITPSTVSAWVRRPNQRETERLRLGDEFEGWTVKTIEPDRLVLERQGETDQLVLRDYANAPAFVPPPPTPLARRQATGRQQRAPQSLPDASSNDAEAAPPARRQQRLRPATP